jgi:uncharacterized protein (DUF362 family)
VSEERERLEGAANLRARAARYRSLAECLTHPDVIAAALECARDLEKEADMLERAGARGAGVRAA